MAKLPKSNVLVLNRYFAGIHVCSLMRAISLAYENKAEIISPGGDGFYPFSFDQWVEASRNPEALGLNPERCEYIRTSRTQFLVPKVIRLYSSNYVPEHGKQLRPTRQNVLMRDEFTCQYCAKRIHSGKLNLDHVVPKSRGGKATWLNLVASCLPCNTRKADRTPTEANMALIRQPFKPKPVEFLTKQLDPRFLKEYNRILGIA